MRWLLVFTATVKALIRIEMAFNPFRRSVRHVDVVSHVQEV
jgi:hypothetical protein